MLEEEQRKSLDSASQTMTGDRAIAVGGNVSGSILITGDHNVLQGITFLPTDYAMRIRNFILEYIGTLQRPVPFGGRQADLQTLDGWLDDPDAPPYLLLTAPAGRGKSALLVRWLERRRDPAPPVVFVRSACASTPPRRPSSSPRSPPASPTCSTSGFPPI